jgi:hypothetical protein
MGHIALLRDSELALVVLVPHSIILLQGLSCALLLHEASSWI